jgi:hypothetical protein
VQRLGSVRYLVNISTERTSEPPTADAGRARLSYWCVFCGGIVRRMSTSKEPSKTSRT